jgi:hypothetical protein
LLIALTVRIYIKVEAAEVFTFRDMRSNSLLGLVEMSTLHRDVMANCGSRLLGGSGNFVEPTFECEKEKFLAIRYAQLVKDTRQMMAHGRFGNTKPLGDITIRQALADKGDNLPLSFCQ